MLDRPVGGNYGNKEQTNHKQKEVAKKGFSMIRIPCSGSVFTAYVIVFY